MMYDGKVKKFRDPIHGYIEIPSIIVSEIIDTELFQRLRYVEQTSMRPLYPAARHDRFIHSLGVYWLGRKAFANFRQNACKELQKFEENFTKEWWDKQELLFWLACLLHDCAHAPFSHTLEDLFILPKSELSANKLIEIGLDDLGRIQERIIIPEVDYNLMKICYEYEKEFPKDFLEENKGLERKGIGAPHEKMSSYCVIKQYGQAINNIFEILFENKEEYKLEPSDLVFMVRMIIGCTFKAKSTENSIKNCIISMLNSSSIDVDGLDYIVRDSYMSGIDNYSIDYQRLLGSFTIIPVEVYKEEKIEDSIDGIWLKDSIFKISEFEKGMINGKIIITGLRSENSRNIVGLNEQCVIQGNIFTSHSESTIEFRGLQNGDLQCIESCRIQNSMFNGTITGKKIVRLCARDFSNNREREYVLGFEKNCLSIIQSSIEARNHEYMWVYTHPKVLYNCNYLQWELLRDSAKYLCCCNNNTKFEESKLDFCCHNCDYYKNGMSEKTEEDYLLYILGYDTFFSTESNTDRYIKLKNKGFIFYHTCDDDLNALFKRIYVENKERHDLKSDKLDIDFREFFSRRHKKVLWKSFVEYENFLNMYMDDENMRTRFCSVLDSIIAQSNLYNNSYGRFPKCQQNILDKYGLKDALVIKSSVKTKELNLTETFINFRIQILRLSDVFPKSIRKETISEDFYYLFVNNEKELDQINYSELVNKLYNIYKRNS